MHIKSLKIFCTVVDRRSFSRAADENGITQSGASQVIHQLEDRLGVKLIDRSKRPFVLTPEGQIFYDGCRSIVQQHTELEDQVRTLHEEVAGRVVVASIYSIGLHHMHGYLQEFLAQHPKANIRLEYLHPHKVYDAVENAEADLGLISYPKSTRALEATPWQQEPIVLVCSPDNPFAHSDSVELKDLEGVNFVAFEKNLTIRHEIDEAFAQHDVTIQVVHEFDNIETIKRAVEINAGVSLLPEPSVQREVSSNSLVKIPLSGEMLTRPIGIIRRRNRSLTSAARLFVDALLSQHGVSDLVEEKSTAGHHGNGTAGPAKTKSLAT